jgi:proteasome assembly chaperone (PAC2) family protein
MDVVRWDDRPSLRRPVLIAAFEGWNDAGDGASTAVRYLSSTWGGRRFATIDPEEFYDFTEVRPTVRLEDGLTRRIEWPTPELSPAPMPGGRRDAVLLSAAEPQLRWRTYCATIVGIAQALGVELVLTLGALLAEVPHTRPVRVTGTAADQRLVTELGLQRSRYEGPTGITGVLHDAFARAGIPSASLWAAVPHYVAKTPSPKAALALVQRAALLLDTTVDVVSLEIAAAAYERQVTEVVSDDDDVAEYVTRLEQADDEGDLDIDDVDTEDVPSAETLAAEAERFLRDQRGD